MGLHPDGADEPTAEATAEETGEAPGMSLHGAVRTPFFVVVTFGFALLLLTQVGGLAHLLPPSTEGVGTAAAATSVSTVAFASIAGRFVGAWLLGRVSLTPFTIGIALLQAAAIASRPRRSRCCVAWSCWV